VITQLIDRIIQINLNQTRNETKVIILYNLSPYFCTVSGNNDVEAQRRTVVVHRRPSRTVVVTRIPRHRIVYVNRRIVRPAIRVLSPAAIAITYGRTKYFYDSGYYYILEKDGYRIVAPPAGMVVTALPSHYVRVKANSISCLYLDGIFYEKYLRGIESLNLR